MLRMIVENLAYQLPLLIVYCIGLLVAFMNYGKHPKPALLAILGCLGLLGATIGRTLVLEYMFMEEGYGSFRLINVGATILEACALGLVIAAIFAARVVPKPPRRDDDYDAPREKREKRDLPVARPKPPEEPRSE